MDVEVQLPDPQLMESMRSVGYSLEAALADIVDNSLSANASKIEILYDSVGKEPLIGILDNGEGMDPDAARVAMQLAGTNRGQLRAKNDLGRFGLGLKTASLSQSRKLTLVTKRDATVTALEWDLDFLVETGSWSMKVLSEEDYRVLPLAARVLSLDSGTLVLWRNLDLLLGDVANVSTFMAQRMSDAADHLELIFHRFIAGESAHPAVSMAINHRELRRIDPFLERNPATQRSPVESVGNGENQITVQSFTLPHVSKLTEQDRLVGRVGQLRDSQGFYVYRNRRLIDWGSWFRLAPKEELAKLARVRIDIPNSLDGLWGLDIKKSRAIPPESVKKELRRLIERIIGQSKSVHTYRGRKDDSAAESTLVWELTLDRESYSYRINRSHPMLMPIGDDTSFSSDHLSRIYALIEEMFPVHDLYARMSSESVKPPEGFSDDLLLAAACEMWRALAVAVNTDFDDFTKMLSQIEPFSHRADVGDWLHKNEKEIRIG